MITWMPLFSLMVCICSGGPQMSAGFPRLHGPYLGQKSPGDVPELFAPGIVSFGYHEHRMAVSPDGTEIYYTVFEAKGSRALIMFSRIANGFWTPPSTASFSNSGMNLHPAFSPNGKRIYFASTRPTGPNGERGNGADIWFVERQGDSWAEPVHLDGAVNTVNNESSPSVAADGTLFFDRVEKSTRRGMGIYASRYKNGAYREAEKLPLSSDPGSTDLGPFVSPDGGYLLFYSDRSGTSGESDIYIAFKKTDQLWSDSVNLGPKINSKYYDWAPIVTPDGKYIVFSSGRNTEPILSEYGLFRESFLKDLGQPKTGNGTFYWVDAGIIEDLKKLKRLSLPSGAAERLQ